MFSGRARRRTASCIPMLGSDGKDQLNTTAWCQKQSEQ